MQTLPLSRRPDNDNHRAPRDAHGARQALWRVLHDVPPRPRRAALLILQGVAPAEAARRLGVPSGELTRLLEQLRCAVA